MGMGLSPRWRGNPIIARDETGIIGSIPALAGQPKKGILYPTVFSVYPRAGGATVQGKLCSYLDAGLSPRWRGNQRVANVRHAQDGSIPALAGQPRTVIPNNLHKPVYPRAGGATRRLRLIASFLAGLSPRWRGNHDADQKNRRITRSIPALAGQPIT